MAKNRGLSRLARRFKSSFVDISPQYKSFGFILIFGLIGVSLLLMTRAAAPGCNGVDIAAGSDIQAAINANPANTTFCLSPGIYRNQSLHPKTGDTIFGSGQGQTILNGSNLVSTFTQSGSLWYASNQTQNFGAGGYCDSAYPACNEPALLYYDDVPLTAATSQAGVTTGKFYFDHAANRVYFANNPTGHKVEIGAINKAIVGDRPSPGQSGGATDVTIRDLTVEKYAQQAQQGAIETNDRWLISNVTSQLNGGQGITLFGVNPHVTYSKFLRNGQIGIGANGGDNNLGYGHAVNAVTVDNTEIAYNNYSHFDYGWEAGGTKFWQTNGSVISHNWVHHNIGPGLWDDGFNDNITFDANQIEDNVQNGIFHEIGLKATITNNLIQRNAGVNGSLGGGDAIQTCQGAICISSGKGVTIANNYIYNNGRGIVLIDDPHNPDPTNNVTVHDNVIRSSGDQAITTSLPSYQAQGGSLADFPIDYNHYTSGMLFGFNSAARSWSEWQQYGKDTHGDLNANTYPVITTAGIQTQTTNNPPVTSITSPTSGSTVSGSVTVNATATDDSGTVSKVELYVDGSLVLTDTTSPYSFSWNTSGYADGNHSLMTKAYDPSNNIGTSSAVTVTVNNGKPDLIVTGISFNPTIPAVGNQVTFSATIKNQGTNATPAGTIHGVAFAVDGTTVSWSETNTSSLAAGASVTLTATGGPSGSATWTATSGAHTILATVDDGNHITESNETNNTLSVSLTPGTVDSTPPTTTITPLASANVKGTVTVNATAADNVGVTKVEFYVDGVLKGTDTTSPYSYSWDTTTATNAAHTLTTKAYDAAGNVGTSATVTATVDNAAPTITITAPANASTQSGTINITATASDNIGVTQVELYLDGNLSGSPDVASPYIFSLNTTLLTNAAHTLTTKAYDAAGNVTTSAAVSITVNNAGSTKAGDINGDNKVDIFDLSILAAHWNQSGQTKATGDLNGDGTVNIFDLSILASNWGK